MDVRAVRRDRDHTRSCGETRGRLDVEHLADGVVALPADSRGRAVRTRSDPAAASEHHE